jgi:hypothetical protein
VNLIIVEKRQGSPHAKANPGRMRTFASPAWDEVVRFGKKQLSKSHCETEEA